MHNTWFKMLRQPDPSKGTVIRVRKRDGDDVTGIYATWLGERNRAVRHIITALDYGYLYNGFLQHSNPQLSKRLFDDYVSGELNWLLWKHVMPLGVIFSPFGALLSAYARSHFPQLGSALTHALCWRNRGRFLSCPKTRVADICWAGRDESSLTPKGLPKRVARVVGARQLVSARSARRLALSSPRPAPGAPPGASEPAATLLACKRGGNDRANPFTRDTGATVFPAPPALAPGVPPGASERSE